jgi:polar amino acid transport system substrate-binding protein
VLSLLCTLLLNAVFVAQFAAPVPAQSIPKVLRMGTSADYKPFEFHDTSGGEDKIVGFDVDVAQRIATDLGFELKIQDMDFNGLIPALQSGRVDFLMAGMTPTPERKKSVDFSEVYYTAQNTIIAPKKSNLTTIESLKGKTVGAQLGSLQQEVAQKIPGAKVTTRNRVPDLIQELNAGRIDAAIAEDTIAKPYTNIYPDLQFTVIPSREGGCAIAFPKGSTLVSGFNRVIATMKQDGTLDKFAKKWFEDQGKTTETGFQRIASRIPFILGGIPVTLGFTFTSLVFGLILAVFLAILKISSIPPLRWFATAYTSIFRGVPLIVTLTLIYFATPQLTGYKIEAFQAGVITFALNSAAYVSETLRAGIMAVDKGQREAAMSLGVPYPMMMRDVILPQAFKNILPALVNEFINLLKDSALVSTIGAADLLRRATIVGAETYLYFEPLIIVAIIYYIMVMGLTAAASFLERRLQKSA